MFEEIDLDLTKIKLYAFQRVVCLRRLDSIVRGIERGDIFDRVWVYERVPGEYHLLPLPLRKNGVHYFAGGHHRAVGHWIEDVKFPAYKLTDQQMEMNYPESPILGFVPLGKIQILDEGHEAFEKAKQQDPRFR